MSYSLAKAQHERPRGDPITLHKHLKCENNKEEQEFLILVPNVLLAFLEGLERKTSLINTTQKDFQGSAVGFLSFWATISNPILCTNSFLAVLELFNNICPILF